VTNQTGCKSDVKKDSVFVYVQPRIDAGPNFFSLQGTRIKFIPIVNDSNRVSFLWTPSIGLLPDANSIRPSLIVTQDQTYTLTATAEGPLACSDSDSLFVKMLLPVKVPNSFTPNGDGINDTWVIPNLKDYPTMRIQVMNRYGQNVFRTYGYGKAWDGTLNGKPLPAGTYFYIIELNNGLKPITGSVSIIR
jgi:gliding motility-associated-like protein